MPSFNHLKKLNAKDDMTVEYPMDQIAGNYVLMLRSATEVNVPYFNAILRATGKKKQGRKASKVTVTDIEKNRKDDRILFAKHILTNWSGVEDNKGVVVEFTEENALDFLESLPSWIFDDIRAFASDILNFIDVEIDAEGTAKN